jgi:hypothetical protein
VKFKTTGFVLTIAMHSGGLWAKHLDLGEGDPGKKDSSLVLRIWNALCQFCLWDVS